MLDRNREQGVSPEWQLAREHLENDHAYAVDIRSGSEWIGLALLWRHVVWSAHKHLSSHPLGCPGTALCDLGYAEVEHLDDLGIVFALEEDVVGFEVAMNYVALMRGFY